LLPVAQHVQDQFAVVDVGTADHGIGETGERFGLVLCRKVGDEQGWVGVAMVAPRVSAPAGPTRGEWRWPPQATSVI
jgi:hypothetical protein